MEVLCVAFVDVDENFQNVHSDYSISESEEQD